MDSYVTSEIYQVLLNLGPFGLTFLLGLITLVLLLRYSIEKQKYWKRIGLPHVKPYPFVGCVLGNLIKPFHDLELERYQKYGSLYGHYEGNRAMLSLGYHWMIRKILVKDFFAFTGRRRLECGDSMTNSMLSMLQGEDWKRVRSIVSATFTTCKLKKVMHIFKDCSVTLAKNFKEASLTGEPVEVKRMYGAFSMDVIASAAFSTKIDSQNDPNNPFVVAARNVFTMKFNWRIFVLAIAPGLMKYFKISLFPPKSLQFFSDMTLKIIEERKRTGQKRNDFLQILMDTAEEVDQEGHLDPKDDDDMTANYEKDEINPTLNNSRQRKYLTQEELVAQCVIFFLAGFDTTSSTLSFISYELALNPDIQERLIQEIDQVLKANDGELSYEAVQSMKYLDNVISETLRLFPPGIRLERQADQDYLLEGNLLVPKGLLVTVPVYAIHRDPELFPEPEKFDPDRFTPEERAQRSQCAYIPFGAGPRSCVGMRFALIQIKVCLAHILSQFRIKRCPQTKVPLDFHKGQGHMEPKNITLLMEERNDKVEFK